MPSSQSDRIQLSYFSLGSLVTVKVSFMKEPPGVVAYVYEVYDRPSLSGISLITQNGVDLGGFSPEEQAGYLEYYGDTGMVYHFRTVIQLKVDWRAGLFRPIFDNLERYKKALK